MIARPAPVFALLAALPACLLHAAAAPSMAQAPNPSGAKLIIDIGWGDKVRAGRWTPVFITTSHPRPLAAVIEVYAQQNGADSMLVRQFLTIGPVATTAALYVPVQFNGNLGPTVILREEATGKTLAHYPPDPASGDGFFRRVVNGASTFVGASGQPTALQNLIDAAPDAHVEVGYLDPDLLPAATVGYEGLNLLVLNRPNLLHLTGSQQRALVDWVLAGGNLILWPGDDPVPHSGPLIEALPCRIAGGRNATIPESELRRLGLPKRFADVRGRRLEPFPQSAPGAATETSATAPTPERISLFGPGDEPDNFAYRRQLGLGRILVAPVALSELRFDDQASAARFWQKLLVGMSVLPHEPGDDPRLAAFPRYNADQDIRRRYAAARVLERFLAAQDAQGGGSGAGTGATGEADEGRADFPRFLVALLGIMVVAGPVDCFVLRRLARRPWTWVTTTAWVVLLLGGTFYLVHLFKSRAK